MAEPESSPTTNGMEPNFLDLPLEIRESIYNYLLESETPPPAVPNEGVWKQPFRTRSISPRSTYLHEARSSPALGLLTANRQLRYELQAVTERIKSRSGIRAKADLMIYDERWLYFTWTCLPSPGSSIVAVDVDWRMVSRPIDDLDDEERGHRRGMSGFRGGAGGPPTIWWDFLDILHRYIEFGPGLQSSEDGNEANDGVFPLEELVCNVVNTRDPSKAPGDGGKRRRVILGRLVDHPNDLYNELCSMMSILAGHQDSYGKMMVENVRTITVCFENEARTFVSDCFGKAG